MTLMANNPLLHYKPGLTMDAPIPVTMAAADWAILMAWFAGLDDNIERGVTHLVYGIMSDQLKDALYTVESIKSAQADYHERAGRNPVVQMFGALMPSTEPRCESCGRAAGMPTAPCLLCPDYGV